MIRGSSWRTLGGWELSSNLTSSLVSCGTWQSLAGPSLTLFCLVLSLSHQENANQATAGHQSIPVGVVPQ